MATAMRIARAIRFLKPGRPLRSDGLAGTGLAGAGRARGPAVLQLRSGASVRVVHVGGPLYRCARMRSGRDVRVRSRRHRDFRVCDQSNFIQQLQVEVRDRR
jgi:hypothetical protein